MNLVQSTVSTLNKVKGNNITSNKTGKLVICSTSHIHNIISGYRIFSTITCYSVNMIGLIIHMELVCIAYFFSFTGSRNRDSSVDFSEIFLLLMWTFITILY